MPEGSSREVPKERVLIGNNQQLLLFSSSGKRWSSSAARDTSTPPWTMTTTSPRMPSEAVSTGFGLVLSSPFTLLCYPAKPCAAAGDLCSLVSESSSLEFKDRQNIADSDTWARPSAATL